MPNKQYLELFKYKTYKFLKEGIHSQNKMENKINIAKNMIKMDLITQSSKDWYEVDGETVRIKRLPGRTLMTCSCKNCSRNINEPNNMCSRKIAVLLYQAQDIRLKKLIRENLNTAQSSKELGFPIEPDMMINLLNDLKRFIL